MKVLQKGLPRMWTKELTCTGAGNGGYGCDAVLLVELNDLFSTQSSALGDTVTFLTFRCPECGRNTDLSSTDEAEVERGNFPVNIPAGVEHPKGGWCHPLSLERD